MFLSCSFFQESQVNIIFGEAKEEGGTEKCQTSFDHQL